ncbi:hypothetical protein Pmar_PMAR007616 [Perkinsus marinus ATCC 50983]|uniref:Uncharacterized protein n=1 Tax=Perkinsus marinus (strain ATCC 50983 / TXsc) TaxID=423536 RepID=C5LQL1_PERM5|nr:hypothetical protein Pmar_PMAR007616 [Perkinsus marinus ATCC 50983]EER00983.1 hypothetical protein Pmar_PMAR007616 [Perkinsus marinus ATCC 50983]|eukprot:XP_002768265.1 hypothetical protein Pmar_PMAR007616 [Perkinsus marinus ATCC 50983]
MERKLKEARTVPLPSRLSQRHKKIRKNGFRCGAAVTTAQGKQLKRDPSAGPVSDVKFWKDNPGVGPAGCWVEITGFVREIAMPVAELSRLVDRFLSDGKVTLMHRNGDTITDEACALFGSLYSCSLIKTVYVTPAAVYVVTSYSGGTTRSRALFAPVAAARLYTAPVAGPW